MSTGGGGDGGADSASAAWFVPASALAWQSIVTVCVAAAATMVQGGVMVQSARSLRRYMQFSSAPALTAASRGANDERARINAIVDRVPHQRNLEKLTRMLTFTTAPGVGADATTAPSIALLSQKFDASIPRSTAMRGGRQHNRVALALRLTWFLASLSAFLGALVNVFVVVTRADFDERLVVQGARNDDASSGNGIYLSHWDAPSAAGRFCQIGTQIGVASYGLSKFWSFMFFFFKARAVRPQLAWTRVEKCVFVASLGILPLSAIGVAWSTGDRSTLDGSCMMYTPHYTILMEGLLDVLLSSSFLWLFVAPLYATLEGTTLFRSSTNGAASNGTASASASKASISGVLRWGSPPLPPPPPQPSPSSAQSPQHQRTPSGLPSQHVPLFGAQSVKLARRGTLVTSQTVEPMIELGSTTAAAAASQPTADLVQQFIDPDTQAARRAVPPMLQVDVTPDARVVPLPLYSPSSDAPPKLMQPQQQLCLRPHHRPSFSLGTLPHVFIPQSLPSADAQTSPSKPLPQPSPRRASMSVSQAGGVSGSKGTSSGPQAQLAASLTVFSAASRDSALRALIRKNIVAFVGTVLSTVVLLSLVIVAHWLNEPNLRKLSNALAAVEIAVMLSALLVLMQRNPRATSRRRGRGVADGGPRVAPVTTGGGGGGASRQSSFFLRNHALSQPVGLDSTPRGLAITTTAAAVGNNSPHRTAVGSMAASAPSSAQRPARGLGHRSQLSGGGFGGLFAPRSHGRFPSRSEMLVHDFLSEEPVATESDGGASAAVVISPPPPPARSAPPPERAPRPASLLDCAFEPTVPLSSLSHDEVRTPSGGGGCSSKSGAQTNARGSWEAGAAAPANPAMLHA